MVVLELGHAGGAVKDLAPRALRGCEPLKGVESQGMTKSGLYLKDLPLAPCGGPDGGAETSDVDVVTVQAS